MRKSEQKSRASGVSAVPLLLVGIVGGAAMGYAVTDPQWSNDWRAFAVEILFFLLSVYVQTVIHEAGHLLAGLLSGYRFLSFRIGSLMVQREGDRLRFRRLHLAGIGGQCLMDPPELRDGKCPYLLYNLGGVLANLLTAAAALAAAILTRPGYAHALLQFFAWTGFFIALLNGVPMRNGLVANDGYNAKSLGKDEKAMRAFWLQMRIHALQTQGTRPKDMPQEWFAFPTIEEMRNPMIATIGVFAEGRAMDMQDFGTVRTYLDALNKAQGVLGLYRNLLTLDRIFIDLLERGEQADVSALADRKMRSFLRQMRRYPAVLRTQYAAALLHDGDADKAAKLLERFEKSLRNYPSAADTQSERELILRARGRQDADSEAD